MIIFSLIKTNYLRNNELFKNKSTKSKGNRIAKMGKLFLTNSLTHYFQLHYEYKEAAFIFYYLYSTVVTTLYYAKAVLFELYLLICF